MAICKFFQQGNCKFGNSCRFEHLANPNRGQSSNRFGAFGGGSSSGPPDLAEKYNITADTIERDLTDEAPQWIFSAYAPGKNAPGQLFGGFPREQSFEELRLHYWTGKASGNEQQALTQAQELFQESQQQMQTATRNSKGAVQFIVQAENNHPNRHDICQQNTQGAPFGEFAVGKRPNALLADSNASSNPFGSNTNNSSPFGGGAAPTTSAFGQTSALGQKPNPFGTPSFGQPSQPGPTSSPFGQPSQPAATSSPFGQPSQPSAFGQPSQPSAFGQPSQPTSAFGQPSQPTSAFGQPSALGAKASAFGTPSFGQPSQPSAQGNAFGQPSQLGQKPNPFGASAAAGNASSPFATVGNNSTATANPFGAPSSNQNNAQPNPFGSNTNNQTQSPFGQPSQPTQPAANPFGQPSSAPAPSNPFASTTQTATPAASNPFAQQPSQPSGFASQSQQPASNPFDQPSQSGPFGQPSNQQPNPFASGNQTPVTAQVSSNPYPPDSTEKHPDVSTYSDRGMDGRITRFKGKPVSYKDDKPGTREFDGTWKRIYFPEGPPPYSKATELPPDKYDEKSKAQWIAFKNNPRTFEGDLMPALPPPRECVLWNF